MIWPCYNTPWSCYLWRSTTEFQTMGLIMEWIGNMTWHDLLWISHRRLCQGLPKWSILIWCIRWGCCSTPKDFFHLWGWTTTLPTLILFTLALFSVDESDTAISLEFRDTHLFFVLGIYNEADKCLNLVYSWSSEINNFDVIPLQICKEIQGVMIGGSSQAKIRYETTPEKEVEMELYENVNEGYQPSW